MSPSKVMEKLEQTLTSWETNAPDAVFYNTTLKQFRDKVQESREIRQQIAAVEQQLDALKSQRDDTDDGNLLLEQNVTKAIVADPNYGDDSALYEGTGRVRKSERKSGLTRKNKNQKPGGGEVK